MVYRSLEISSNENCISKEIENWKFYDIEDDIEKVLRRNVEFFFYIFFFESFWIRNIKSYVQSYDWCNFLNVRLIINDRIYSNYNFNCEYSIRGKKKSMNEIHCEKYIYKEMSNANSIGQVCV